MPPARVPLIVGNLGARAIMAVAKGERPERDPLLDSLARRADEGFAAVEDYVGWSVVEPQPDRFDFSLHVAHRDAARRAGLGYVVYAWLHALPRHVVAARAFTPFTCLEHGQPCGAPSLFAPETMAALERFLAAIRSALGDDLYQLTLACPSDYGEVGYPTGMGAWVQRFPPELDHWHEGFWCGDAAAHADFRAKHDGEVPEDPWNRSELVLPRGRRRAFDAWYRGAPIEFIGKALTLARARFASTPLGVKCGYAGEKSCYGQDPTALARLSAAHGASLWSTHGTLPTLHHKRIQTACRVFGADYRTEGITERSAEDVRNRLFEDAADGARSFFEFEETVAAHGAELERHAGKLTGEAPRVDVALLFHGTGLALEPRLSLPPRLLVLAEPLRDRLDFDVVDEESICAPDGTGALDGRGVLVVPDPGPTPRAALVQAAAFADRGGIVVLPASPAASALETGGPPPWPLPPGAAAAPRIRDLLRFRPGDDASIAIEFGGDDDWFLAGSAHGIERAAPYFGGGADRDDARCRWTGGDVVIRVPFAVTRSPRRLVIELFAPERCRPESWHVDVDGEPIAEGLPPGAVAISARIPADRTGEKGALLVRLTGPTFRPHHDDGRGDHRDLGVLLKRVTLGDPPFSTARLTADAAPEIVRAHCVVRRGKGGFVFAPNGDLLALAACAHAASTRRSQLVDGATDFPDLDGFAGQVRYALSERRLLAYNRGPHPFSERVPIGDGRAIDVNVAPRDIGEFVLDG